MLVLRHSTPRSRPVTPEGRCVPNDASNRGPLQRERWLNICATRLRQLRPHDDPIRLDAMALELWFDVATFDPAIAAEMEHESWQSGH